MRGELLQATAKEPREFARDLLSQAEYSIRAAHDLLRLALDGEQPGDVAAGDWVEVIPFSGLL